MCRSLSLCFIQIMVIPLLIHRFPIYPRSLVLDIHPCDFTPSSIIYFLLSSLQIIEAKFLHTSFFYLSFTRSCLTTNKQFKRLCLLWVFWTSLASRIVKSNMLLKLFFVLLIITENLQTAHPILFSPIFIHL